VLSFVRDGQAAFAAALAARPREEDPLTAARSVFHLSLRQVPGGAEALPTYLSAMQMSDATPALLAAYLRFFHDHDDEIIAVLARREGVDPAADRRPRVLAAVIGALVFLANRDGQAGTTLGADEMTAAFDAYADQVRPALAGHWD
jgi:hypothetical protein